MKKSELKLLIKETYSEFQRAAKGNKGVTAKKKGEEEVYGAGVDKGEALEKQKLGGLQEDAIDEVMVGGESVDPNVVSALMAIIPTLVGVGAAVNWKEEITTWLKSLGSSKKESINEITGIEAEAMGLFAASLAKLLALGAAINWKKEIGDWFEQMTKKYGTQTK